MAVTFSVPKSPAKSVFEIDQFLGVDLTNKGTNIDERRSPNAPNMVREVPGKVRKRRGYQTIHTFENGGTVFGAHKYNVYGKNMKSVTNVNRVIEGQREKSYTSTLMKTYECYDTFMPGQTLYVECDINTTGEFRLYVAGNLIPLPVTNGYQHFSAVVVANKEISDLTKSAINLYKTSGSIYIKNMSVMYKKDDSYTFTQAPEDNDGEFNYDVIYSFPQGYIDRTQLSSNRTDTWTDDTLHTFVLSFSSKEPSLIDYNAAYIEFKASVSTSRANPAGNSIRIIFYYKSKNGGRSNFSTVYETESRAISKLDFSGYVYFPQDTYLYGIEISVFCKGGYSTTYSVSITDIKTAGIMPKPSIEDTKGINSLLHVGTSLFKQEGEAFEEIYSDMNANYSSSFQFEDYVYIVDGKNYLRFDPADNKIVDVFKEGIGYLPTIFDSKPPEGGGVAYEDLNLLQPGFTEQFLCENATNPDSESALTFNLSFGGLDSTPVKAWILNSSGNWVERKEDTHFKVDRTLGRVTFTAKPGKTPLSGKPNVRITAYKTFEGYADKVRKCTFGTTFGVGGASDRLFLSGNPEFPNYDWHCQYKDPTYFPDTAYATLGMAKSAIVGYSIINNYLATHKDENEPSQSVFIREGDLVENEGVFRLVNTLQGAGSIAPRSFNYLETEPLFLTRKGIFAITAQDISGEKYGQNRSFYLNGKLLEEKNLENAHSVVYNDFYILAINNKMYILDGLQAMQTDKSMPYSTRQYAGFYCTNIPASIMWVEDGDLWFGTKDGRICKFYSDKDSLKSYNDDGAIIQAWWETPDLDGRLFFKNKTFRYVAIRLMTALSTSVTIYGMKRGIWSLIKKDTSSARYFSYENITFSKFTWSVDQGEKVAHSKTRVKKVDKARFKLENNEINEPFGIFNFAVEYVESGNYKG